MKRNYVNEKERKENYIGRRIKGKLFNNTFGAKYLVFGKYKVSFTVDSNYETIIFYVSKLKTNEFITTLAVPLSAANYLGSIKDNFNIVENLYNYHVDNNVPVLKQEYLFNLFDDEDLYGLTNLVLFINNIKNNIEEDDYIIRSVIIYNESNFKLDCGGSNMINIDIPKSIFNSLIYYEEPTDALAGKVRTLCFKFNHKNNYINIYPSFNQIFGIEILVVINHDFTVLGKGFKPYKIKFKTTLNNLEAALRLYNVENNSIYKILRLPSGNDFVIFGKKEAEELGIFYEKLIKDIKAIMQ